MRIKGYIKSIKSTSHLFNIFSTFGKKPIKPDFNTRYPDLRFQDYYYNQVQPDLLILQFQRPNDQHTNPHINEIVKKDGQPYYKLKINYQLYFCINFI